MFGICSGRRRRCLHLDGDNPPVSNIGNQIDLAAFAIAIVKKIDAL